MSTTEQKVRRVRVKKAVPPGLKGRWHRFRKTGYMANQWYWYILFILIATIAILGLTFGKPSATEIKGNVMDQTRAKPGAEIK